MNSYNRECPKGRQRGKARQEQTDSEVWDAQKEAQGETEEEPPQPPPRSLSLWKKYGIIRLS